MMQSHRATILICFICFVFSLSGIAQQPLSKNTLQDKEVMITFITPQMIRVQVATDRDFEVFLFPDSLTEGFYAKVLHHEDRFRLDSKLFSFEYNTQPGLSPAKASVLTTKNGITIKPFAINFPDTTSLKAGVLVLDNAHGEWFPESKSAVSDKIIIITQNTFSEQLRVLELLSGKIFEGHESCRTPQIYFKPIKGKALMTIVSNEDATIYFTRDGSEPTRESEIYRQQEMLGTSIQIRAFAIADGYLPSEIGKAQIVMSKAREITWRSKYSPDYCGFGEYAFMDGIEGHESNKNIGWIGIPDNNLSVTVELNKTMNLSMLGLRFLHDPAAGIFLPQRVQVEVSEDGWRYKRIYRQKIKPPDAPFHALSYNITARFRPRKIRYVRVTALQYQCEERGPAFLEGKTWIFTDELRYEQHAEK